MSLRPLPCCDRRAPPAEAVFIDYVLERDETMMGLVRRPLDRPLRHLPDEGGMFTHYGLEIGYGYDRCAWSEVPKNGACQICAERLDQ